MDSGRDHPEPGRGECPGRVQVLWALLAVAFNLYHLFLARRIRRRSPLDQTDRGLAERLRAKLWVWEAPLDSYLFNIS